jgi:carbamoyl-phosphate synthase large subunit
MTKQLRVLVAGIGGASLGTEIAKCLLLAQGRYAVFGCDVAPLAYGHFQEGFERTFVVDRSHYVESVLRACREVRIDCIVPGGEEPLLLLSAAAADLEAEGIHLAANAPSVIAQMANKRIAFDTLASLGFTIPRTRVLDDTDGLRDMTYPCVVKPATGSGGSTFVFLAENHRDAMLYVSYLASKGRQALVQEYIPETEGEFTIGVLSLPDGNVLGSIALRRLLTAKLSVLVRSSAGLISTGYSQGLIDAFPEPCAIAERIAAAIGSRGAINVQGRVRNGTLIPFEVNPRFSASTYLRALAGFNEIDLYLRQVLLGERVRPGPIRPGYYLRSLCETYVPLDRVKP